MKINGLHIRTVSVPLAAPHRTAMGVVDACPLVLVRVMTDAGVVGNGIIFTYTASALKPVADFINNLESLLRGYPVAPSAIWHLLHYKFRLLGTQGLVGMAIAGIDMALWDASAKQHAVPLYSLLGASNKEITLYAPIAFDGAVQCAKDAEKFAKVGFKGVKAKIGYRTLSEDLAVIGAIRSAVGSQVSIMVDYNQSLNPTEAECRLRGLDDMNLAWIEEPVLAQDYEALARLSSVVRTPLQAGENWWGPQDFRTALDLGIRDLVMLDVMKSGGITGWQQVAQMVAPYRIPCSSHLWPEVSHQLLCANPDAHWLEYMDWWNPILNHPLQVADGLAFAGEEPGIGIEFKEASIARFEA
jgi:mandelate racemase